MVKDLAAGWETLYLAEFGSRTLENNRLFPESGWKSTEAFPKVVAFLKHVEDQPDWRIQADQHGATLFQNRHEQN